MTQVTASSALHVAQRKTPGTLQPYCQCVSGSFEKNSPVDECAGTLVGGVGAVEPGATAYLSMHLVAGHYGYVSTAGAGQDFMAGLHGEFDVS